VGESPPTDQFEYTLKIINPSRMSDFKNVDIHAKSYCSSLDELRKFIASKLPATVDPPDMEAVDMGFIEPRYGGKGRKVWLFSDEDLPTMYKTFKHWRQVVSYFGEQPFSR